MYYDANGNLRTKKMEYVKGILGLLIGILSICWSAGFIVVMYLLFTM